MWNKIRKILGKLTDWLIKGRQYGLWSRDQKGKPNDPTFPDVK